MNTLFKSSTATPPPPLLAVNQLTYTPPGDSKPLIHELSFSLHQKNLMCLAGINGSGKTTLLCLLAGLLPANPRTVVLNGRTSCTTDCAQWLKNNVAILLQDADMQIIGSTVEEDILLSARLACEKKKQKTTPAQWKRYAQAYLSSFNLAHLWSRPVHLLSHGQKRKLTLAAALLSQPELLLLDEPLSGLDYPATLELLHLLKRCKKLGTGIIISTHDLGPFIMETDSLLVLSHNKGFFFQNLEQGLDQLESLGVRNPRHF